MFKFVIVLTTGEIIVSWPMAKSALNKAFGRVLGEELQSIRFWEDRPASLEDIACAYYMPA